MVLRRCLFYFSPPFSLNIHKAMTLFNVYSQGGNGRFSAVHRCPLFERLKRDYVFQRGL